MQRYLNRIVRRAKRFTSFRSLSTPLLSGDVFAKIADVSVYSPFGLGRRPTLREVSAASVIFCPSHKYEDFISEFGDKVKAKVLILGNSDRDFHEPLRALPRTVKQVFAQNLLFEDPLYSVLPIGVENARLAMNGRANLFDFNVDFAKKKDVILVGPFGATHGEREKIPLERDFSDPFFDIRVERMSPMAYADLNSKYRYVLCPRGNGMDTHRLWETLYRGGIPIVKPSIWANSISGLGVPVVISADFSPAALKFSVQNFDYADNGCENIPPLWLEYWLDKIRNYLG